MACKCKKDYDAAMALSEENPEDVGRENIFKRIVTALAQIGFGIIAFAVIIVMMVPFLLYVFAGLVTGRRTDVRLTRKGIKFGLEKKE